LPGQTLAATLETLFWSSTHHGDLGGVVELGHHVGLTGRLVFSRENRRSMSHRSDDGGIHCNKASFLEHVLA
jgi:hypothetical protein